MNISSPLVYDTGPTNSGGLLAARRREIKHNCTRTFRVGYNSEIDSLQSKKKNTKRAAAGGGARDFPLKNSCADKNCSDLSEELSYRGIPSRSFFCSRDTLGMRLSLQHDAPCWRNSTPDTGLVASAHNPMFSTVHFPGILAWGSTNFATGGAAVPAAAAFWSSACHNAVLAGCY